MSNNSSDKTKLTYRVTWSNSDSEYVGLCDQFPYLSWLDADKEKALAGIKKIVEEDIIVKKAVIK